MEDTEAEATLLLVLDFSVTRGEALREKENDQIHSQGEVIDRLENAKSLNHFCEYSFHDQQDI